MAKSPKIKKAKAKGQTLWSVLTIVFAVLMVVMFIAGPIANSYASIINMVLGTETTKTIGEAGEDYFTADYATSAEQAAAAEATCESIVANGAVLMMNRNAALPLENGSKISLFSINSARFVYGGTGSGGMDTSTAATLKDALERDGFAVNSTMWDFYTSGAGAKYGRKAASGALNNAIFDNAGYLVNEVPLSAYTNAEWDSAAEYGDAAVVVFSRVCGEGSDLPWYGAGDGNGNILALSSEEKDLLGKLAELKAQGEIRKIVVLLNGSNAVELSFLEPGICGVDYGIDACMWIGEVGQSGIEAIGDLLNGSVNPSGHLTDTYCYDNLTSPAIQNAHVTSYTNAADAGLAFKDTCNEYYVAYQEGIYVGYRYYETRYEDVVLGRPNTGSFNYDSTVAFSFGHGLSYTTFEYSNFKMEDKGDAFSFTVDVTNTGDMDGQEVVQIYMQSPYTEYDQQNGVEKASVELVGFDKQMVNAGETVSFTIPVDKTELRAYDVSGAGTYILDAGNYYFAAGNGAHDALNNILAMKAEVADGSINASEMTDSGNAALAAQWVQDKLDTDMFANAPATGSKITNQLDHADLNRADDDTSNDIVYVSRSNWEGTMPKAVLTGTEYAAAVQIPANEQMVQELKNGITYDGADQMPVFGKEGNLSLAQFIGVGYDETITVDGVEYSWDDLLDQVTFNEMAKLIGQTYHSTVPVASVSKPATKDENGPQGITATLTGGAASTSYTSEDLMAATFDRTIARNVGVSIGNDCLLVNGKSYSGIYGPGVNIHRTPYSGRNFEYYSEDPFLSGKICAAEVSGIQSKGVYVYMKHFAMNDQETGRDGICVWSNEQAAREIYLQAFEYPIEEANAYCVMTSFNRMGTVWAGGDRNLLTNILRGEWGMSGFALTDFSNSNKYMDVVQGVLAGGDGWDCNNAEQWTAKLKTYNNDPAVASAMREAAKHIFYTVANSNAMNGISTDLQVIEVRAWWQNAILALQILFTILTAVSAFMLVKCKKKGKESAE